MFYSILLSPFRPPPPTGGDYGSLSQVYHMIVSWLHDVLTVVIAWWCICLAWPNPADVNPRPV